jgi:hypothetical protein
MRHRHIDPAAVRHRKLGRDSFVQRDQVSSLTVHNPKGFRMSGDKNPSTSLGPTVSLLAILACLPAQPIDPTSDRLVSDVDSSLRKDILDISQTESELQIKPDCSLDENPAESDSRGN